MTAPYKPPLNDFMHTSVRNNGRLIPALQANCSRCGEADIMPNPQGVHSYAQHFAEKNFTQRGWRLGNKRKNDVCPKCVAAQREQRAQAREANAEVKLADVMPPEVIEIATRRPVVVSEKKGDEMPKDEPMKADPPPEMTRFHKQTIFAKLLDVYAGEQVGYSTGWSDKRLAEDLGVPRAWVTTVRDENFGPEASNEDTRKLVAEAKAALADAKKEADRINGLVRDAMQARDDIRLRVSDFEKRIAALEALYR